MSFSSPTKYCPRCNTLLPMQAIVCSTCGMRFSVPGGSGYGATYPDGQSAPGGWAQNPPGYSPTLPGYGAYPPGQPGPAGAPQASRTRRLMTILLVVVVVIGGATAGFFYLHSHTTDPSSFFFDRHGLQSNVPLPNNITFALMKSFSVTDRQTRIVTTINAWGWQVNGSDRDSVLQFYRETLPNNGWTRINNVGTTNGEKALSACQSGQLLIVRTSNTEIPIIDDSGNVTDTVLAPAGGSALLIELSISAAVVAVFCSDNPPIP